jgi:hypothetical protein
MLKAVGQPHRLAYSSRRCRAVVQKTPDRAALGIGVGRYSAVFGHAHQHRQPTQTTANTSTPVGTCLRRPRRGLPDRLQIQKLTSSRELCTHDNTFASKRPHSVWNSLGINVRTGIKLIKTYLSLAFRSRDKRR